MRGKVARVVYLKGTVPVFLKSSSMVVRVTMDLFEHRYYRLSKILMMLVGQWPYQNTFVKRGILAVLLILIGSEILPPILAVVKYRDNRAKLLECLILNVTGAISAIKLLSFIVHSQKRLKLINLIRTDWQVWARDREVNILHRYTAQGEKLTILYTVAVYSVFFAVMAAPVMPTIVNIFMANANGSTELPYPIVYYNIDMQKYYLYLIIYTNVCAWVVSTIILSNDVILVTYVQHVCGIFAALGHKLKRIGNNDTLVETGENPYELIKKDMEHLASCIDRQNGAIEYANLIEASYTRILFVSTGLGVILINVVGLQILMGTSDPTTFARFTWFILGILLYYYAECYISQTLINHSLSIRLYMYNSQWYKLPPTSQKNLQLMMIRSSVPCQLTAGTMMILSMRTFWLTMKTCMSFFGFLRSTQEL